MVRLFTTLSHVAEARLRYLGRRASVRGTLIAGCVLAALTCIGFALAAATVALAGRVGIIEALAIMAGLALLVVLILLAALAWESRRNRILAVRRAEADRQLFRAAALSMTPAPRPSRSTIGLGLVSLGALLVLMRRRDDD